MGIICNIEITVEGVEVSLHVEVRVTVGVLVIDDCRREGKIAQLEPSSLYSNHKSHADLQSP